MTHTTPAGTHDATAAAELLGVSKKALLKRMRELGWLRIGGDVHNLPHPDYVRKGYLTTQQRGYQLKGNTSITKTYTVMLLTQLGYNELKKIMQNEPNPTKAAPAATQRPKPARPATTVMRAPFNRARQTQSVAQQFGNCAQSEY